MFSRVGYLLHLTWSNLDLNSYTGLVVNCTGKSGIGLSGIPLECASPYSLLNYIPYPKKVLDKELVMLDTTGRPQCIPIRTVVLKKGEPQSHNHNRDCL